MKDLNKELNDVLSGRRVSSIEYNPDSETITIITEECDRIEITADRSVYVDINGKNVSHA